MEELQDTEEKHKVGYDWCKDENGKVVKIENATRGKHNYFCHECGCQMIARKGDERAAHFAHDATDVERYGQCEGTYMTYAHQVASNIIQRLKYVKVPILRKYPPSGMQGKAMLLKKDREIKADRVENEMQFYEDSNGKMCWGRRIDFTADNTKNALIKPDISFFDANNVPILLIEIYVTHEVKEEKLIKIQHLGIDTIEITIGRHLRSEEIEIVITSASKTVWIYNNERESTKYISSEATIEQSSDSIDEFERTISQSGESFKCRKSQISNVIRGFRKYMESSEFGEQRSNLDLEIEQFEEEKEEFDTRFDRLQKQAEKDLRIEFEERRRAIEGRRAAIDTRLRELANKKEELGERYNRKKREIDSNQTEYRAESQPEIDRLESEIREHKFYDKSYDRVIRDFESEEERIAEETIRIRQSYLGQLSQTERETGIIERETNDVDSRRSTLQATYHKIEMGIRAEFEELENAERSRHGEVIEGAIGSIKNRNTTKIPKFRQHFEGFYTADGFFTDFNNEKNQYSRLRKAKEFFDTKSYKDWV